MSGLFWSPNFFINRFSLMFYVGDSNVTEFPITSMESYMINKRVMLRVLGLKKVTRRYVYDKLLDKKYSTKHFESEFGSKFDKMVKIQRKALAEAVENYSVKG